MRAKISGVNTVHKRLSDGSLRVYYYHRHTGTRLEGKPGSPEFIASYARAERKVTEHHPDLCAGLIRAFLTSPDFENSLQPTTQKEYRRILTAIEAKFGHAPIAAMEDPRFGGDALDWRDEIAATKLGSFDAWLQSALHCLIVSAACVQRSTVARSGAALRAGLAATTGKWPDTSQKTSPCVGGRRADQPGRHAGNKNSRRNSGRS